MSKKDKNDHLHHKNKRQFDLYQMTAIPLIANVLPAVNLGLNRQVAERKVVDEELVLKQVRDLLTKIDAEINRSKATYNEVSDTKLQNVHPAYMKRQTDNTQGMTPEKFEQVPKLQIINPGDMNEQKSISQRMQPEKFENTVEKQQSVNDNNAEVTPPVFNTDPLQEISKILSQLQQNKNKPPLDQSMYVLPNNYYANVLPPTTAKSIEINEEIFTALFNLSLKSMESQKTMDAVANALLNNKNFRTLVERNINNAESFAVSPDHRPDKENFFSVTGYSALIIIIVCLSATVLTVYLWQFVGIKCIPQRINKFGKKGPAQQSPNIEVEVLEKDNDIELTSNSSSSSKYHHLKNVIRKSVIDEDFPEESRTEDKKTPRQKVKDFVSVEGFKKWDRDRKFNNNKGPSAMPKQKSSHGRLRDPRDKYARDSFENRRKYW
ncbi:hypothetical protein CDAR_579601 [Caerostris darwini]|uniref:Uncharacterized protein n=1 Tax=Caerostris darwini TaxID=1538125 RepID=A0AAV4V3B5_9ARAC|nr:hypothetical protein CDAR_579601 [Caerostris darwini]